MDNQLHNVTQNCGQCGQTFKGKFPLLLHKSKHKMGFRYIQSVRRKYFLYFRYRYRWKAYHVHNFHKKSFDCLNCQKSFIKEKSIQNHMEMCHSSKDYRCLFCGIACDSHASLVAHCQEHSNEEPYHCGECNSNFVSLTDLTEHEKLHLKSHSCYICFATFKYKGSVRRHFKKVHPTEPPPPQWKKSTKYHCITCGKYSNRRRDHLNHLKTHLKKKPQVHTCNMCGKVFRELRKLNEHLQKHCHICGKLFRELKCLNNHIQQHHGTFDHVCPHCCKSYKKNVSLKGHLTKEYFGEGCYACCPVCGMETQYSCSFLEHYEKHCEHDIELAVEFENKCLSYYEIVSDIFNIPYYICNICSIPCFIRHKYQAFRHFKTMHCRKYLDKMFPSSKDVVCDDGSLEPVLLSQYHKEITVREVFQPAQDVQDLEISASTASEICDSLLLHELKKAEESNPSAVRTFLHKHSRNLDSGLFVSNLETPTDNVMIEGGVTSSDAINTNTYIMKGHGTFLDKSIPINITDKVISNNIGDITTKCAPSDSSYDGPIQNSMTLENVVESHNITDDHSKYINENLIKYPTSNPQTLRKLSGDECIEHSIFSSSGTIPIVASEENISSKVKEEHSLLCNSFDARNVPNCIKQMELDHSKSVPRKVSSRLIKNRAVTKNVQPKVNRTSLGHSKNIDGQFSSKPKENSTTSQKSSFGDDLQHALSEAAKEFLIESVDRHKLSLSVGSNANQPTSKQLEMQGKNSNLALQRSNRNKSLLDRRLDKDRRSSSEEDIKQMDFDLFDLFGNPFSDKLFDHKKSNRLGSKRHHDSARRKSASKMIKLENDIPENKLPSNTETQESINRCKESSSLGRRKLKELSVIVADIHANDRQKGMHKSGIKERSKRHHDSACREPTSKSIKLENDILENKLPSDTKTQESIDRCKESSSLGKRKLKELSVIVADIHANNRQKGIHKSGINDISMIHHGSALRKPTSKRIKLENDILENKLPSYTSSFGKRELKELSVIVADIHVVNRQKEMHESGIKKRREFDYRIDDKDSQARNLKNLKARKIGMSRRNNDSNKASKEDLARVRDKYEVWIKGGRPYCPLCGKVFIFQHTFESHKVLHEKAGWFICYKCGKVYRNESSLVRHYEETHVEIVAARNWNNLDGKDRGLGCCSKCKGNCDFDKTVNRNISVHRRSHTCPCHHGNSKVFKDSKKVSSIKLKRTKNDKHCSICNKTFKLEKTYVTHMQCHKSLKRTDAKNDKHCSTCNKTFKHRKTYVDHLKSHKSKKGTNLNGDKHCSLCNKTFYHRNKFVAHLRSHKSLKLTKSQKDEEDKHCSVCNKRFLERKTFVAHLQSHRDVGWNICIVCGKTFNTYRGLQYHHRHTHKLSTSSSNVSNHNKKEAGKNMSSGSNGRLPDTKAGANKTYKCPACRRTFKDRKNFASHIVIHEKSKWYICCDCCLCFWLKEGLAEHRRDVHNHIVPEVKKNKPAIKLKENKPPLNLEGNRPPVELKESRPPVELKENNLHNSSHVGSAIGKPNSEKLYCSLCNVSWGNKADFGNHITLHRGEGWFMCVDCGNSYRDETYLADHRKRNHKGGEKCLNKSFHWKQSYGIDSEVIVDLTSMTPCKECGEYYGSSNDDLQSHLVSHIKEETNTEISAVVGDLLADTKKSLSFGSFTVELPNGGLLEMKQ